MHSRENNIGKHEQQFVLSAMLKDKTKQFQMNYLKMCFKTGLSRRVKQQFALFTLDN